MEGELFEILRRHLSTLTLLLVGTESVDFRHIVWVTEWSNSEAR
jgi:hypothetical protein